MYIYISHSTGFDYQTEIYDPVRKSSLNQMHQIILPHEQGKEAYPIRDKISTLDLFVAEISFPSTGTGIEIGWADVYQIPIIALYKAGTTPSNSIHKVTDNVKEYTGIEQFLSYIEQQLTKAS